MFQKIDNNRNNTAAFFWKEKNSMSTKQCIQKLIEALIRPIPNFEEVRRGIAVISGRINTQKITPEDLKVMHNGVHLFWYLAARRFDQVDIELQKLDLLIDLVYRGFYSPRYLNEKPLTNSLQLENAKMTTSEWLQTDSKDNVVAEKRTKALKLFNKSSPYDRARIRIQREPYLFRQSPRLGRTSQRRKVYSSLNSGLR